MDIALNWLAGTPDFAVPYALAALGLIVSERAGVLSLHAEGLMLVGALAGTGAQLSFGQPVLALVAAMAAASGVSVLFAVMVVWLRINQVIAGLALVFFCQGGTALVGTLAGWTNVATPGIGHLAMWPQTLSPAIGRLVDQNAMVWATLVVVAATAWFFDRTRAGLTVRAVGENPQAADAAGLPVTTTRFLTVLAGAALVGLGGAYISVVSTKIWTPGITGGRGWIAVGLVIFSRWSPWRALAGALLFGGIEALIPQLAAAGVQLPQYFVLMAPYAITLAVMVRAAVGRHGPADPAPGALGTPYLREERQ